MSKPDNSIGDAFVEALVKMPFWVTFGAGLVCYAGLEWWQRSLVPAGGSLFFFATSVYAPMALVFFVSLAVIGSMHRVRRAKMLDQQTGLDSLRHLPWKDFEFLVAEMFRRDGHAIDYGFHEGADGGVDVVLKKAGRTTLVQCKRWNKGDVGVAVVREMFGILHDRNADEVLIVTTSSFTLDARRFAKGKPISLIDGPKLWELIKTAQNGHVLSESKRHAEPMTVVETPQTRPASPGALQCPRCDGPMFKAVSRKGIPFWGCHRHPNCTGSRSIEPSPFPA